MSEECGVRLSVPEIIVTDADSEPTSSSGQQHAQSSSSTLSATNSLSYSKNRASASGSVVSLAHPADILTFRYMGDTSRKGKQVWVDAPATYDAAIDRVVTEFRHELGSVDRRDIALLVGAKLGAADAEQDARGFVRIGRSDETWTRVISTLVRYEIVEVHIDGPDGSVKPPAYTSAVSQKKTEEWMPTVPRPKPLLDGKGRRPKPSYRRIASWFAP